MIIYICGNNLPLQTLYAREVLAWAWCLLTKINAMNKLLNIATAALLALSFTGCSDNENDTPQRPVPDVPEKPIVILYDNDVHCELEGYAKLAAQQDIHSAGTPYVTTVSCGDFASGDIAALLSKGEYIVDIMNEVGYDVAVPGNHELDYGIEQTFKLTNALDAQTVCANLQDMRTNEYPYPAYEIIEYGDVEVAYIGFTTTTIGMSKALCDEDGNVIYSLMREGFYERAQWCIDAARSNGADYVIALTHLGETQKSGGHPSSVSLIANTTGIDAVIDGHDHHVIEGAAYNNKEGKPVLLTSSGTKFEYVGKLVITTEGKIESSLIDIQGDDVPVDEDVQQFVDRIKEITEESGKRVIGHIEADMSTHDANGERIVRKRETGIGNFIADAFRAYANTEIAMVNGGGVRAGLKKGDVSINDLYAVLPFGDVVHTATITGQNLLDALEFAASFLPDEDGTFMQVSGMRFKIDSTIPTPVVIDTEKDLFSHVGDSERRVSDLEIWDNATGTYKPVELSRTYTMTSIDYLLMELGGSGVFRYAKPDEVRRGTDIEAVIYYVEEVLKGNIGAEYSQPEGRITIR